MSTKGNVSGPREAASVPRLSNKALDELKKGATVEIWVECDPYTVQVNGVPKEERRKFLCSLHRSLVQHFSAKLKRDLADNSRYCVLIPFAEEPAKLVVGWMMVGGGNELGMPDVPYPKKDLKRLTYLKTGAAQLEMHSLVAVIEKDIAALVPPTIPAVPKPTVSLPKPTASLPIPTPGSSKPTSSLPKPAPSLSKPTPSLSKPTATETKPENRVCYYCNKPGHIMRNCLERDAVHVTYSQAQTLQLRGPAPAPAPAPAAVPSGTLAVQTVSPPRPEPVANNRDLILENGDIVARDEAGNRYHVESSQVERIEVVGPVTDYTCKVRITAIAHIW